MAWSPQHYTDTDDITHTDFDDLARQWGSTIIDLQRGFRAVICTQTCKLSPRPHGPIQPIEHGQPGDVILDHRQRMERHIINAPLYDFISVML